MTYTLIISRAGREDLIFKGVLYFVAEPGRVKLLKKKWITIEDVTGLILHEEQANEG